VERCNRKHGGKSATFPRRADLPPEWAAIADLGRAHGVVLAAVVASEQLLAWTLP